MPGGPRLAGGLSGCGTVENLGWGAREKSSVSTPHYAWPSLAAETAVYGGIQIDLRAFSRGAQGNEGFAWSAFAVVLSAIDFPLSLVGDTLTLPYTLPLELSR